MYMTYEQVEANWIIKNVAKTKRLEAKVKQLIDEKYELLELLK